MRLYLLAKSETIPIQGLHIITSNFVPKEYVEKESVVSNLVIHADRKEFRVCENFYTNVERISAHALIETKWLPNSIIQRMSLYRGKVHFSQNHIYVENPPFGSSYFISIFQEIKVTQNTLKEDQAKIIQANKAICQRNFFSLLKEHEKSVGTEETTSRSNISSACIQLLC